MGHHLLAKADVVDWGAIGENFNDFCCAPMIFILQLILGVFFSGYGVFLVVNSSAESTSDDLHRSFALLVFGFFLLFIRAAWMRGRVETLRYRRFRSIAEAIGQLPWGGLLLFTVTVIAVLAERLGAGFIEIGAAWSLGSGIIGVALIFALVRFIVILRVGIPSED